MTRWIRMGVPMVGALLLLAVGCSSTVGESEGAEEELSMVRKADFANRLMYIDLAVSPIPMHAEELGDLTDAVPVVMRFYDDWAVAWYAPDGEALVGNPDNAVRMWRVQENVHVLNDEVNRTEEPTTTVPHVRPSDAIREAIPNVVQIETDVELPANEQNYIPFAFIDWMRDYYLEWEELPSGFHPECV